MHRVNFTRTQKNEDSYEVREVRVSRQNLTREILSSCGEFKTTRMATRSQVRPMSRVQGHQEKFLFASILDANER